MMTSSNGIQSRPAQTSAAARVNSLRELIPTSILRHYDHLKTRGKRSVAAARRGVFGSCHLAFPSGSLASLRRTKETLNVCVNWGAFVYLAEEEPVNGSANAVAEILKKGPSKRAVCSSPSTDASPQSPRANMTKSNLSLHEVDAKGCDCKTDRVDLVRTLRNLTGLEIDSSNSTPKLEFARLTLRQKLPPNVLVIHDKLIAEGRPSIAPRFANACTECSGEVSITPNTKRLAEMFVECPHCGTLLYG